MEEDRTLNENRTLDEDRTLDEEETDPKINYYLEDSIASSTPSSLPAYNNDEEPKRGEQIKLSDTGGYDENGAHESEDEAKQKAKAEYDDEAAKEDESVQEDEEKYEQAEVEMKGNEDGIVKMSETQLKGQKMERISKDISKTTSFYADKQIPVSKMGRNWNEEFQQVFDEMMAFQSSDRPGFKSKEEAKKGFLWEDEWVRLVLGYINKVFIKKQLQIAARLRQIYDDMLEIAISTAKKIIEGKISGTYHIQPIDIGGIGNVFFFYWIRLFGQVKQVWNIP